MFGIPYKKFGYSMKIIAKPLSLALKVLPKPNA